MKTSRLIFCPATFSICWYLFLTSAAVEGQSENESTTVPITDATNAYRTTIGDVVKVGHEYVVELKFYLNEKNVSEFVSRVLFHNLTNHNITTKDLISVADVENAQLATVEGIFNISLGNEIDLKRVESVFRNLDISLYAVYKELFNTLIDDPRDKLPKILDRLGVNKNDFMDVIIFGNDTQFFDLLRGADLSAENLKSVFELANLDMEKLYGFMMPILLTKLKLYPLSQFIVDMTTNGINESVFAEILRKLGVQIDDYHKNGAFNDVFLNFVKDLNGNGHVGVVTGERNVVTSLSVYQKLHRYEDFVFLTAEVVEDRAFRFTINNFFLFWTNGPVSLQTDADIQTRRMEIASNYNVSFLNCTYVTVSNGKITETVYSNTIINNKYLITTLKYDNVVFKSGSPLICNQKLYGIARKEDNAFIQFSTFYSEQSSEPSEELITDKSLYSSSPAKLSGLTFLAMLAVLPFIRLVT